MKANISNAIWLKKYATQVKNLRILTWTRAYWTSDWGSRRTFSLIDLPFKVWKLITVSSSKNTYIGHWNQINFVLKANISNAIWLKKYATQVKNLRILTWTRAYWTSDWGSRRTFSLIDLPFKVWKFITVSSSKNTCIGHWNQINFFWKLILAM